MSQRSPILLVTARQAAHMLSISERTLWTLTKSGQIAYVMVGCCKRYAIKDLEAFIQKRTRSAEGVESLLFPNLPSNNET